MDVSFRENAENWIEITVDSDAEDAVCPHAGGGQFGLREVEQKMNLVNANGGKINNYGQRQVVVKTAQSFQRLAYQTKGL